jgi:hypothetical protein
VAQGFTFIQVLCTFEGFFIIVWVRVWLCNLGSPWTRDPPASATPQCWDYSCVPPHLPQVEVILAKEIQSQESYYWWPRKQEHVQDDTEDQPHRVVVKFVTGRACLWPELLLPGCQQVPRSVSSCLCSRWLSYVGAQGSRLLHGQGSVCGQCHRAQDRSFHFFFLWTKPSPLQGVARADLRKKPCSMGSGPWCEMRKHGPPRLNGFELQKEKNRTERGRGSMKDSVKLERSQISLKKTREIKCKRLCCGTLWGLREQKVELDLVTWK